MTELFYGDELDLRDEIGREEREEVAKEVCISECPYRFSCLQFAILNNEGWGVWGGMSQGERREFKVYLRKQGYTELPTGSEFRLNVNHWEGTDGFDGTRSVRHSDRSRHLSSRYASPTDEPTDRDVPDDPKAKAS